MTKALFLHGWAQSRQIWCNQFAAFDDALFLNLPGHGGAQDQDADHWVETLIDQFPAEPVLLVGWSLGGMLAMQMAAHYPDRVAGVVLVSATPRFRTSDSWQYGSSDELFDGFKQAVESGSAKALNRFFALMLHGDDLTRSDYNQLAKMAVDRNKRVTESGMKEGLKLLQDLDLRTVIARISQPTLLIHGAEDAVIPAAAGIWLAKQISGCCSHILPACGHAPFLTKAETFNQLIQSWWSQQ